MVCLSPLPHSLHLGHAVLERHLSAPLWRAVHTLCATTASAGGGQLPKVVIVPLPASSKRAPADPGTLSFHQNHPHLHIFNPSWISTEKQRNKNNRKDKQARPKAGVQVAEPKMPTCTVLPWALRVLAQPSLVSEGPAHELGNSGCTCWSHLHVMRHLQGFQIRYPAVH